MEGGALASRATLIAGGSGGHPNGLSGSRGTLIRNGENSVILTARHS
ncbi:MAG: hypothetical protein V2G42_06375 [bacterium JZ-2024 1]